MKKPEILAPAGDLERLKIAVHYGADAIYLGGPAFNLRQGAANFSKEDLSTGVALAHEQGVKIFLTLNIFPHHQDLEQIPLFLKECQDLELDGIILSDPGLISLVKEYLPLLPLHLSTQANTVNWRSASFWQRQGFQRLILARELSYAEIREIRNRTTVGLEVFAHGSLCLSYSGRCYLSSYLTGRDANQGDCAHACRWKYHLMEEKRPGEYFPVQGDARGTYILNSRDLCLIEEIPRLMDLDLQALKIEGRMKGLLYVATVVKIYRQARDLYLKDPDNYVFQKEWLSELKTVSHRDYTRGFFGGSLPEAGQIHPSSYIQQYRFLGLIHRYLPNQQAVEVEVFNRIRTGDTVEIFGPTQSPWTFTIGRMLSSDGEVLTQAPHPRQIIYLSVPRPLEPYSLIRRREE